MVLAEGDAESHKTFFRFSLLHVSQESFVFFSLPLVFLNSRTNFMAFGTAVLDGIWSPSEFQHIFDFPVVLITRKPAKMRSQSQDGCCGTTIQC